MKKLKLLFNKNIIVLLNSMIFSEFGNIIYSVALNFWILDITKSTALLGFLSILSSIPRLLLSPIIGVYVDRHSKKNIIICMDIVRGLSTLLLGLIVLFRINNISFIILNSMILSVCGCFYQTSINSSLIYIFSKDKFIESNSLCNSLINVFEILASSISGFLLVMLTAPILFLLNGISFLVSALSETLLNLPKNSQANESINLKNEIKDSLTKIYKNKELMNFLYIRCGIGFLLQINIILIIPIFYTKFTKQLYGIGSSFIIVGSFVGAILLVLIKKIIDTNKLTILTLIAISISFIGIGITNKVYLTFVLMFFYGIFFSIYNILTESKIIITIDENGNAKVLSIIFQIIFICASLGNLIGGILAEFIAISTILVFNSTLIIIMLGIYYAIVYISPSHKYRKESVN